MSGPRVSVIIPTWDAAELLRGALWSLRKQTYRDFEILVVDNGSRDGTDRMLHDEFPEVRHIRLDRNRGFGAAINAGIGAARGEYLVTMNNDVEAEPRWLEALVNTLDRHPEAGSVASKMLNARRPELIDAAGDAMSLVAWNRGRGEPDGEPWNAPREVLSCCAGAAAYRRAVFDTVGAFDESFFAWFEDVDLGLRAQIAGFRCRYEPSAVVRHLGSATAGRMGQLKAFLTVRNGLVLFFQTMPLRRLVPWAPVMLVWPWLDPIVFGRPFRAVIAGWFAFWPRLPGALAARRRAYARRRVPDAHLVALLESPLLDLRRGARALLRRAGLLAAEQSA